MSVFRNLYTSFYFFSMFRNYAKMVANLTVSFMEKITKILIKENYYVFT